jgi:hypothetical protein
MGRIKLFVLILIFNLIVFGVVTGIINAQTNGGSSTWKTIVGNPITNTNGVLGWAQSITNILQVGYDGSYNKMVSNISNSTYTAPQSPSTNIGNLYWCTYLIIDSYALSGINGLSRASHSAVVYMMQFWRQTPGFVFLDYYSGNRQSVLSQVQPGYVIFYQANPGQTTLGTFDHVAIVKSLTINNNGDGTLETYDSNTTYSTRLTYPVDNWNIRGLLTSPSTYAVMGFGTTQ